MARLRTQTTIGVKTIHFWVNDAHELHIPSLGKHKSTAPCANECYCIADIKAILTTQRSAHPNSIWMLMNGCILWVSLKVLWFRVAKPHRTIVCAELYR